MNDDMWWLLESLSCWCIVTELLLLLLRRSTVTVLSFAQGGIIFCSLVQDHWVVLTEFYLLLEQMMIKDTAADDNVELCTRWDHLLARLRFTWIHVETQYQTWPLDSAFCSMWFSSKNPLFGTVDSIAVSVFVVFFGWVWQILNLRQAGLSMVKHNSASCLGLILTCLCRDQILSFVLQNFTPLKSS